MHRQLKHHRLSIAQFPAFVWDSIHTPAWGVTISRQRMVRPFTHFNPHSFFTNKEFNYSSFIKYLVDYTFDSLSHNAMIELQKAKLSHAFINLFTKYLEEL